MTATDQLLDLLLLILLLRLKLRVTDFDLLKERDNERLADCERLSDHTLMDWLREADRLTLTLTDKLFEREREADSGSEGLYVTVRLVISVYRLLFVVPMSPSTSGWTQIMFTKPLPSM